MAKALAAQPSIRVDYDSEADVLYVSYGLPRPGYGDQGDDDIILRFSEYDDSPTGATIVGYRELGWPGRLESLGDAVGRHLHIDPNDVVRAINEFSPT